MSKWTKGPWGVWNGSDVFTNYNESRDGYHVADCNVHYAMSEEYQEISMDQIQANAKLIAQAPVLAEELATMVDIMESILSDPDVTNVHGCHADLNDILAAKKALKDAGWYDE